ncbi:MAG TPA: phenylalanine--tRNA ligase subunit beta, partial [Gammaproteobacteria bacterium]|nr:phenylalanine--tRNA ligase subunit beta [Gammaproteobacteria bacterium]
MKVTESWLREWVNPKQDISALADLLSLSGLEVDAVHTEGRDHLLDINITPNRGDCLSIKGLARELAALTEVEPTPVASAPAPINLQEQISVQLESKDCPVYIGRIIRGVDNTRPTPDYIQARLEQLGVRCVSLIVDLANYVMLELGQPLHAFDLAKIGKTISVRDAKAGEQITLLDDTQAQLDPRTLVIADEKNVLALAGVMGGLESGVTLTTEAIFLESAHFLPQRTAGKTRLFNINSEGAYRFERGVDPNLIQQAIERVSQLILQHAGGQAGPLTTAGSVPAPHPAITLQLKNISRILGMAFPQAQVSPILQRLGMNVAGQGPSWQVSPPSFRFDIALEEDLIEEL